MFNANYLHLLRMTFTLLFQFIACFLSYLFYKLPFYLTYFISLKARLFMFSILLRSFVRIMSPRIKIFLRIILKLKLCQDFYFTIVRVFTEKEGDFYAIFTKDLFKLVISNFCDIQYSLIPGKICNWVDKKYFENDFRLKIENFEF